MTKYSTKAWLKAASVRAIKTVAQTALGMLTVGAAFSEVDWVRVGSVALMAGIYSLITSVAGLPELEVNTEPDYNYEAEDFIEDEGQYGE